MYENNATKLIIYLKIYAELDARPGHINNMCIEIHQVTYEIGV